VAVYLDEIKMTFQKHEVSGTLWCEVFCQ